jgi:hypothetical protein
MSKPNKIKVIRKLCDTQLNFNTGFINNDQMAIVGIASTTFLSADSFCMYGNRRLGDNISANIMTLGGPGCKSNAGNGLHYFFAPHDQHEHSAGGAAAAGSGGNFIATKINNFNDSTSWCVKNLGVGNTNSIICNVGVDAYVLANAGSNASDGSPGLPHLGGTGAAGQAGITTSLSNTFTSPSIYSSNTCCVQGCPGTSCNCCIGPGPDFLGCGGHSGFQNSSCCTVGVLTSFYTQRYQGNAGNCRGGWVHVNSTGRDDKVL